MCRSSKPHAWDEIRCTTPMPRKDAFLKDVPRLIIEHNLHGIDIDPRCAQIAGLSLWLRAQKAWQRLGLKPAERPAIKRSNIVCAEPMPGEKELLREFVEREFPLRSGPSSSGCWRPSFDQMQLAGEAGSLLKIEEKFAVRSPTPRNCGKRRRSSNNPSYLLSSRPPDKELKIDLSGITDEQFWDTAEGASTTRCETTPSRPRTAADSSAGSLHGRGAGLRLHRSLPQTLRRSRDESTIWRRSPFCL